MSDEPDVGIITSVKFLAVEGVCRLMVPFLKDQL